MSSMPGERRGGRKKGTPNKATVARKMSQAAAERALERLEAGPQTAKTPQQPVDTSPHSKPTIPSQISEDALRLALVDAASGTMTVEEAVEQRTLKPFSGSAHDFLRECYRDPRLPRGMRMDAAKAAIRYETPALAATTLTLPPDPSQQLRDADTRTPLPDIVRLVLQQSAANGSQFQQASKPTMATAATDALHTLQSLGDARSDSDTPLLDALLSTSSGDTDT